MEYLVAVADDVEHPRAPPLRYPADIDACPNTIGQAHHQLQTQGHMARAVLPVDPQCVECRNHPGEAHGKEEGGANRAEAGGREGRGEEGDDCKEADGGDGGEVDEAGEGVAEEGVVDGRDEGGDDHN